MALTVTEANAVNALLGWILAVDPGRVEDPPMAGEAREAAELLAAHAHKTLGCGLTGDRVAAAWRDLILPAVGP